MHRLALALLVLTPSLALGQAMDDAARKKLYLECVEQLESTLELDGWENHRARIDASRFLYSTHRELARRSIEADYEVPKPRMAKIWERVHAVVTMGRIGDPHFFPRVLAALDAHKDSFLMEQAAQALPKLAQGNEARAIASLKQVVENRPARASKIELTRRFALQAMASLGDAGALAELKEIFHWEGGSYHLEKDAPAALWIRMEALRALIEAHDPSVSLDSARAWARHEDANVRRHAARLIAQHGTADDLPLLEKLLEAEEAIVRNAAADGVARLGEVAVAQAAMSEDALNGSLIALDSLTAWGTVDVIPTLVERRDAERSRAATHPGAGRLAHYTTGAIKALIERHHPALAKQALAERTH